MSGSCSSMYSYPESGMFALAQQMNLGAEVLVATVQAAAIGVAGTALLKPAYQKTAKMAGVVCGFALTTTAEYMYHSIKNMTITTSPMQLVCFCGLVGTAAAAAFLLQKGVARETESHLKEENERLKKEVISAHCPIDLREKAQSTTHGKPSMQSPSLPQGAVHTQLTPASQEEVNALKKENQRLKNLHRFQESELASLRPKRGEPTYSQLLELIRQREQESSEKQKRHDLQIERLRKEAAADADEQEKFLESELK